MKNKQKITITISADILKKVDQKIDKIHFKNRSHVIEGFVRE
jgi:metal-responsive CopG/Arc/MetJ family transcriptional regulator